jgi:hypothetical protein
VNSVIHRIAPVLFGALFAASPLASATPTPSGHKSRVPNAIAMPIVLHAQFAAQAGGPAAQAATQIDVLVINGAAGSGGIGAGLQNLPQLARPPFSAYGTLTLVSRTTLPLGAAPATVQIPNGNSAQVTSAGRQPNGRYQVNVQLTLNGRTHAIQFAAAPGDPFFTAQTTGPNSALILGFVVH